MRQIIYKLLNRLKGLDIERWLASNVPTLNISASTLLLAAMISVYTVLFSLLTILRHYYFQSYGLDLAIYAQVLYNSAFHGKLLGYTIESSLNPSNSFFGVHFSPFMFLLVPFYRVLPYAEALLALKSFILALGAAVVYKLAQMTLKSRLLAISFAASYLLYTPIHIMNWVDFQLESFIPLLILLTYYYYVKRMYSRSFLFLLLSLSTFEIMPVLLFPFGLYILIKRFKTRDQRLYALGTMTTCVAWFGLAASVMNFFNPIRHVSYNYPWIRWGTTYSEVLVSWVTRPVEVLQQLFVVNASSKALYIIWLLLPLAFTPLSAPLEFALLVLPWPVLAFLTDRVGFLDDKYAGFITAQIFIASIRGIETIKERLLREGNPIVSIRHTFRTVRTILILSIIASIAVGPFSPIVQQYGLYSGGFPQPTEHKEILRSILKYIPPNASVLTLNEIAPHLANRPELYMYVGPPLSIMPPSGITFDYIVLDLSLTGGLPGLIPFVNQITEGNYSLVVSVDRILLYEHGLKEFKLFTPLTLTFNYRNLILYDGGIVSDPASISGKVFVSNINADQGTFWHGPYVALPPGEYTVTFWLKPEREVDGHLLTLDVMADNGTNRLAIKPVYGYELKPNEYTPIELKFSTKKIASLVEFRGMYALNLTRIYLDFIEVRQLSPTAVTTAGDVSFNYMSLTLGCGKMRNGILTHNKGDGAGNFWYGPYTRLPPGKYTTTFWLKLNRPYAGHILALDATANQGRTTLSKINVSAKDFSAVGEWQKFKLYFELKEYASYVEFRGMSIVNDVSVSLSKIEVSKVVHYG